MIQVFRLSTLLYATTAQLVAHTHTPVTPNVSTHVHVCDQGATKAPALRRFSSDSQVIKSQNLYLLVSLECESVRTPNDLILVSLPVRFILSCTAVLISLLQGGGPDSGSLHLKPDRIQRVSRGMGKSSMILWVAIHLILWVLFHHFFDLFIFTRYTMSWRCAISPFPSHFSFVFTQIPCEILGMQHPVKDFVNTNYIATFAWVELLIFGIILRLSLP